MEHAYDEFNIQIGKRIKKLRLQREYTREYLAECADISAKFLYEVEAGKKGCSVYVLHRLAISLGVTIIFCRMNHNICCQNLKLYIKNFERNSRKR